MTGSRTGRRRRESAHATGPTHDHGSHAGRAWTREEALCALESPERRLSQDPEALWTRLGLARGETVVDVGAGTGFFALVAARRVGPEGRVYAADLSEEMVELLRERRDGASLPQLEPVRNTLTSIPRASNLADVVLLANVLHDIPDSTLAEAVRLLKPNGRFVNIDWKAQETPGGPPPRIRLSPEQAEERLAKQGLSTVERWEFGPWHYGLTLKLAPGQRGAGPLA